ncbi:MAG: hypothetical protein AAF456_07085 [Planctomycetota bacterium]
MVRQEPFGEWVNVFYDPDQIDAATMLDLIIKEDCPNAKQTTRAAGEDGFVLNPMIAPGDPVQFEVQLDSEARLSANSAIPEGWSIFGESEHSFPEGKQIVTLITGNDAVAGDHPVVLIFDSNQIVTGVVTVVDQVGQH